MPGAEPPVPRMRPGSKSTRPSGPVVLVASTSLLRAMSRNSTPASGAAVMSERASACRPSAPVIAESPMSEITIHCVARSSLGRVAARIGGLWPRPRTRGDQIDAGLQLADRVAEREVGDDVLVELGGDVHRPAPHLGAVLGLDFGGAVAGDGLQEIVARDRADEIAVADAVDVDRHFRGVDGGERRAELALPRQHVGAGGEMRLRRAVAHVDLIVGGLEQRLAHRRGQAFAQHDRIAFAML